VAMAGIA